ncbi:monooxygenase [Pseudoruegeria sp. HB172150]|uniref:monooxygenase n=1 Tax=Pseudoruegeria sp. HB172150 TaxID=2721164 RepID=UPI001555FFDC|nr:monooxygenase [Pseudoruegeria sp. HB172150]
MLIEIVTFDLPETMTRDEMLQTAYSVADKWRKVPELVRKSFYYDGDNHTGGAVYQWKDPDAAEQWHDEAWRASIRRTFGSDPRVRRFDMPLIVDNEMGKTEEYPAVM